MTAEEIMTLGDVGQELTLLEKNQSPLSEAGINKAIDFYLGEHPIKRDPNLEDEWIKEKHIDPQTNAVTWVNRKQTHTKLCLPYAQQIVMTASAFLIGKGLNLVFHSDEQKDIDSYATFTDYWDKSNFISELRQASDISKIETRAALFFFVDTDNKTKKSKVKVKLLCKKTGYNIWRHKDENEKMDAVVINYIIVTGKQD